MPQIRRLWEEVGMACGRKRPSAPVVRLLWDDRVVEAVLSYLRDTTVGRPVTVRRAPEEDVVEITES